MESILQDEAIVAARFWQELAKLWNVTRGDERVRVAVLDTSVDVSHEAFVGAHFTLSGPASSNVRSAHGTAVASILFAQHRSRVKGVAPDCHGILISVYDESHEERGPSTSQQRLAHGILAALELGAGIINISGGELVADSIANEFLDRAVRTCAERGVLIVAAAGNDACRCIHVPAALHSVLAVGAMDDMGVPLPSSNFGDAYGLNGILAPGKNISAAVPNRGFSIFKGTSYASPLVAGVAGLLASFQLKREGTFDMGSIRSAILQSATPCQLTDSSCAKILAGRLNIAGAINLLFGPNALDKHPQKPITTMNTNTAIGPSADAQNIQTSLTEAPSQKGANPSAQPSPPLDLSKITPSDCGCGCGGKGAVVAPPQLCYALGKLDFDFGSEARRDSFVQAMSHGNSVTPSHRGTMLEYLRNNETEAAALHWTLNIDETPIYVLRPSGPFAHVTYRRFIDILEQQEKGVERVSVPGYLLGGTIRLLSGEIAPILLPEDRGMSAWSTGELVDAVVGKEPADPKDQKDFQRKLSRVRNFLDRVYYELRNLGVTSADRAVNYAATNAYQVEHVFEQSLDEEMEMESIAVEKSPICRAHSDCWDVKLTFFHPRKRLETARIVHRFTVDVSDVVPVSVGETRSWFVY